MIYLSKTYRKFTTPELMVYLKNYKWGRNLKQFHIHHTWLPSFNEFNGSNHDAVQWGMENYHVNTLHWGEIAQHLSLFPDGIWVMGRNWDRDPASILGWNTGAFCVEQVGNFDIGHDPYKAPQSTAMYEVCKYFVEVLGVTMKFHRDSPTAYKTCPGTGIDRATFVSNVANFSRVSIKEVDIDDRDGIVNVDALNMRSDANTSAPILITLNKDTKVKILTKKGDWYRVQYADKEGFCFAQYITSDNLSDKEKKAIIAQNKALEETKVKAEELKKQMEQFRTVFKDMVIGGKPHWANDYVNLLYDKKIVKGTQQTDGSFLFNPDIPITRAESAVLLAKTYESLMEQILGISKKVDDLYAKINTKK
jgi:hypothetical protein